LLLAAQATKYYDYDYYPNDPFATAAKAKTVKAAATVFSAKSHAFHLLCYYFMQLH